MFNCCNIIETRCWNREALWRWGVGGNGSGGDYLNVYPSRWNIDPRVPVSDKTVPEWGLIQPYRRTIAPTPPHCQKPDAIPDFSVFIMQYEKDAYMYDLSITPLYCNNVEQNYLYTYRQFNFGLSLKRIRPFRWINLNAFST